MNEQKIQALNIIEEKKDVFFKLSDEIWDNPETAFKETISANLQIEQLKQLGFEIKENLANIPTAFSAKYGSGHPIIGILGEFDALSGLSQQCESTTKTPIQQGGAGHGCGHNLLGVGGIASAYSVQQYLKENKKQGTIIYYGCPGEEGGSGKAFMARDGVFDEIDCALTWHPGDTNATSLISSLANFQINYKFKGISSHAAACPELGRSALDALELMNMGVQFLREHIISEARVHYAITNTGGFSPNVVQPEAEAIYLIRAPKTYQVQEIYQRINKIAQGAAMMTETQVEIDFIKACSNLVPNKILTQVMYNNLVDVPLPAFTQKEREYAKNIADTFENKQSSLEKIVEALPQNLAEDIKKWTDKPIYEFVMPLIPHEKTMPGSTDVGDVSWVCPTAQISAATMAANTPGHSWQLVSQGKSNLAHEGMLWAAKVIAASAIDLIDSPKKVQEAKLELEKRLPSSGFVSPIPKDVVPSAIGGVL